MSNTVLPKPFATDYEPGSISFAEGFLGARTLSGGQMRDYVMVYDHDLAKAIILDLLSSREEVFEVEVGLDGDFFENSDILFDGEEFNDFPGFYPGSVWAEPTMVVTFQDGTNNAYRVWKKEDSQ